MPSKWQLICLLKNLLSELFSRFSCVFRNIVVLLKGYYRKSRTLKQYNSMSIKWFAPCRFGEQTLVASALLLVLASCSKVETFNTGERAICIEAKSELYIKEMKNGVYADWMSCHKFSANQFRLYLSALAYILFQDVRHKMLGKSSLKASTLITLRNKIIFSPVKVTEQKN